MSFSALLQIEIRNDVKCLVFTEWASKANPGGILRKSEKPKTVSIFETNEPSRCPVSLFQKYIAKRFVFVLQSYHFAHIFISNFSPEVANVFYLYPKTKWQGQDCWFTKKPMGRHALESVPKTLLAQIGIEGYFTLHSLRSTSATRLFVSDVPEQCIKEVCVLTSGL